MSVWGKFSEEDLEAFADRVWGEGRYRSENGRIRVVCVCGSNANVYVDGIAGRPLRFQVDCPTCNRRGTARASRYDPRRFSEEELKWILQRDQDGLLACCPDCSSPVLVDEIEVCGKARECFDVRCSRCRSAGQLDWPP